LQSFDEPIDWQKEELKKICLQFKINNPVIGDLYDPNKPDLTRRKQAFHKQILKDAEHDDIYMRYKSN
jgi:hypothetical protein